MMRSEFLMIPLLTKKKWLGQEVALHALTFSAKVTTHDHSVIPRAVKKWESFEQAVTDYRNGADDTKKRFPALRIGLVEGSNESSAKIAFSQVLSVIKDDFFAVDGVSLSVLFSKHSSNSRAPEAAAQPSSIMNLKGFEDIYADVTGIRPDILVKYQNKNVVAIECKAVTTFRELPAHDTYDLVDHYLSTAGLQDAQACKHKRLARDCIHQWFKYMYLLKIGHGVISSTDVSYFF